MDKLSKVILTVIPLIISLVSIMVLADWVNIDWRSWDPYWGTMKPSTAVACILMALIFYLICPYRWYKDKLRMWAVLIMLGGIIVNVLWVKLEYMQLMVSGLFLEDSRLLVVNSYPSLFVIVGLFLLVASVVVEYIFLPWSFKMWSVTSIILFIISILSVVGYFTQIPALSGYIPDLSNTTALPTGFNFLLFALYIRVILMDYRRKYGL